MSAAELRARALATESLGFSGYAVSAGNLALPVTDQLSSVADLFSNRTTMRVWWRGPADNRVDVVTPAGETGTHTGPGRHLDLAVRDGDRDPHRRATRSELPAAAGRAAELAGPPAAVGGDRGGAVPHRCPAGGRPGHPRACA